MTRDRIRDVRGGSNLRWLICLVGLPLLANPARTYPGPDPAPGSGAWRWVGQWWSVPPEGCDAIHPGRRALKTSRSSLQIHSGCSGTSPRRAT